MTVYDLSPHLQDPPPDRFRQGVVVDSHEQLVERMKLLPPSMKMTWISVNAVKACGTSTAGGTGARCARRTLREEWWGGVRRGV